MNIMTQRYDNFIADTNVTTFNGKLNSEEISRSELPLG